MNFRNYLIETADKLDISILAAGKYLTSDKKRSDFLSKPVVVEHKTDGVKLTIIKKSNTGHLDDYIVAYKGNILYTDEYNYQPNTKVKKESIGSSQFKEVFTHLTKLGKNAIPVGTELFIEYLMRKPTLSSNYSRTHKMVLIAWSKSTWTDKFGKLKTSPNGFNTQNRDSYAKELKIDVPQLLFSGVMGTSKSFQDGIINKNLRTEFNKRDKSMSWDVDELLIDDIRELFLSVESKYGGKEEGVVIKYDDRYLKFQQEYQVDQVARLQIKMKYREDNPLDETNYWNNVKRVAFEISQGITVGSRSLPDVIGELSDDLRRYKLDFTHSKKGPAIIKDDIQVNAKNLLIKSMEGNNNALILGKFRVLTKDGHVKLIERALRTYDNVVIDVVTNKETKGTKSLRERMLKATFPGVTIINSINGNLTTIIQKSPHNINVIYAGSDRVRSYQDQLKHTVGVTVKEMTRSDSDISASKVIDNIDDKQYFIANTPKQIHDMYDEIRAAYKDNK